MGVLLVFFVIAAAFGVMAYLARRGSQRRAKAVLEWPRAEALVTSSDMIIRPNSTARYMPWITYNYEVGGQTYEGDRIRLGGRLVFSNQQKAEDFLKRFPSQGRVQVYYDPKRPKVALLDPSAYSVTFIAFLVLAISIGAIAGVSALITLLSP